MKTYKKASEIRVGVIGYGGAFNMGRQHLLEMQKAGMTPVAVAEVDPARLAIAKTDFPGIGTISSVDSKPKQGVLEITGTKGTLVLDHGHTTLFQQLKDRSVQTRIKNPDSEGHRYYENIAAHLTGKADLIITAEWSRRPIHILDLATRSTRAGKSLPAKYK